MYLPKFSRREILYRIPALPWVGAVLAAPKRDMIVQSTRPEDLEMPLDGFRNWITPVERFYVRTHLYAPKVNASAWRLKVGGLVKSELALTLDDLKKLPRVELVSVLECAGNGRGFYEPGVTGLQWKFGAVGNGRWAGVRLADVMKRAGVQPSAKHLVFNGADVPIGTMPDFVRSIPLEKAMKPDTILAYEMNGEALPEPHGYPLRLVVPGWAGDSWMKWVTDIRAQEQEFDGFFMKSAYRRPVHPVAPGTALDPAEMTPVTQINTKSVIVTPVEGQHVGDGPVTIRGVAWSGESPVTRVDVSADNGRTWQPAKLGADRAQYGWRLWEASWKPPYAGSHVLLARATDQAGNTQPHAPDWNPSGYLWNVVHQVRVEAGGPAAAPQQAARKAAPAFPANVKGACIGCHEADMITGQKLTRTQWEREIDKMVRWGATVKAEERASIVDFLVREFGR